MIDFGGDDLSCPTGVMLTGAGENGGRKCVAARSVDSRANRRLDPWSSVFNTSISDNIPCLDVKDCVVLRLTGI